jgi:hypothetical protein
MACRIWEAQWLFSQQPFTKKHSLAKFLPETLTPSFNNLGSNLEGCHGLAKPSHLGLLWKSLKQTLTQDSFHLILINAGDPCQWSCLRNLKKRPWLPWTGSDKWPLICDIIHALKYQPSISFHCSFSILPLFQRFQQGICLHSNNKPHSNVKVALPQEFGDGMRIYIDGAV